MDSMEIEGASSNAYSNRNGDNKTISFDRAAARGTFLVWENLFSFLPNFGNNKPTKRLLQGLYGYAEPGRIMAIMGPSGSGKSTLLDSLAGLFFYYFSSNVIICRFF